MSEHSEIKCPNCGTVINVDDLVYRQQYARIEAEYQAKIQAANERNRKNLAWLNQEKSKLQSRQEAFEQEVDAKLKEKLKSEKLSIEERLRKDIDEEKSEEIELYKKQLYEQSEKLKASNKLQAELEQAKRENAEVEARLKMEMEKQYSEKLIDDRKRIEKEIEALMQNRLTEKDQKLHEEQHKIEQMRKQIEELQRKADQPSMQLQGEVQEIAIEEYLRTAYPYDVIKEVPKGVSGADCMQEVHNSFGKTCGIILYESKRTKNFGGDWIEKFKADIRQSQADLGILVTRTLPKDMENMGQREGVWICTFEEFKILSAILREQVIKVFEATQSQENKGDKKEFLYQYLTGSEFQHTVEAIVEGFSQMREDLQRERNAMEKLWKQREKQIEKIVMGTIQMYGSIKGIIGNAVGTVELLELTDRKAE